MRREKIIIFITLICIFFYSSCKYSVSHENLEDIKKIEIGMHFNQVKKNMRNAPFKQDTYNFEPDEFISFYDSPLSSSGDFSITYSKKDSIVKRIYRGE